MSLFTAMLILVLILIVIPILYWIGLGLNRFDPSPRAKGLSAYP